MRGSRRLHVTLMLVGAVLIAGCTVWSEGDTAGGAAPRPKVLLEYPVTANSVLAGRADNSPVIAADPSEPRFVALANRVDAPDYSCSLHLSGDGGRLWTPAAPVPELPAGAAKCYAPEVAFDDEGTLYYLFVGLRGAGNEPMGAFLTTSADRGRKFTRPTKVLGAGNYQVRMALDHTMGQRGRLHLVWLHATADPPVGGLPPPPNPIMSAYSDDGGRRFSAPVQVSDPSRRLVVAPAVALGPDHRVHVVYYDLQDDVRDYQGLQGPTWEGKWAIVATSSNHGGERFEPGVVVDDAVVPPERVMLIFTMPPPAVAVDGDGRVFVAWHDARNGDWDVFLRRSRDAGRSWAAAQRLNDDPRRNGRHQYLARLAASPSGRIDAVFYDRRRDTENRRNRVSYTFSTDAGRAFSPNVELTSTSSDSTIGPTYALPSAEGLVEFGGRLALLSQTTGALSAWTDTRNSIIPPSQEILATTVHLAGESAGRPVRWPVVAVVVGSGVALVAIFVAAVRRLRHGARGLDRAEPPR